MDRKVSIDPGLNATGWCVWLDGSPVRIGTIRPKSDTFIGKVNEICSFLDSTYGETGVSAIAVEKFQGHTHRPNMLAMMKCSAVRGAIIARALRWTSNVVEANKQTIKKTETALLARSYFLKGSKDAMDALQIGICAGFDKK